MGTKETSYEKYRNIMCINCANKNNENDLCNIVSCNNIYKSQKCKLIKCVNYKKG